MTVYRTTAYSERNQGDTENRDSIAGRSAADERYPIIGPSGTFTGVLGNQSRKFPGSDSDYFVIDIKDGVNDWAGSVAPGQALIFDVRGNLDIQYRLVDYTYLGTFGPYGKTTFYRTSVDKGTGHLSVPATVTKEAVLAFGWEGDYSIAVRGTKLFDALKRYAGSTRSEGFKLHGESKPLAVEAGSGNDLVWLGKADDEGFGGDGRDILIGGDGNDRLYGQGSADQLLGGRGNDEAFGGAGNDYVNGEWGNDSLYGDEGSDLIHGGFGRDRLFGGAGSDTLYGGSSPNPKGSHFGGPILIGWDGARKQAANPEYWTVAGEAQHTDNGADTLSGGSGSDTLYGQGGKDRLNGGGGADRLWGGSGADVFEYTAVGDSPPSAKDVIEDFARGIDKISLSAIDADVHAPGDQIFIFLGLKPFSGLAGELRASGTKVEADVDGDRNSDIVMVIRNGKGLSAGDFYL